MFFANKKPLRAVVVFQEVLEEVSVGDDTDRKASVQIPAIASASSRRTSRFRGTRGYEAGRPVVVIVLAGFLVAPCGIRAIPATGVIFCHAAPLPLTDEGRHMRRRRTCQLPRHMSR